MMKELISSYSVAVLQVLGSSNNSIGIATLTSSQYIDIFLFQQSFYYNNNRMNKMIINK